MSYRKKERELLKYDYIILVLSIIGLVIYTTLFLLVDNAVRYLFLIFGIYTIITLSMSLFNIIEYIKVKKIKKYNGVRVNLKLFNDRRRKVRKALEVQY